MRKSDNSLPRLFANCAFRPAYNSTHKPNDVTLLQQEYLHPKMAAIITLDCAIQ